MCPRLCAKESSGRVVRRVVSGVVRYVVTSIMSLNVKPQDQLRIETSVAWHVTALHSPVSGCLSVLCSRVSQCHGHCWGQQWFVLLAVGEGFEKRKKRRNKGGKKRVWKEKLNILQKKQVLQSSEVQSDSTCYGNIAIKRTRKYE